jgi:hypothetical protein
MQIALDLIGAELREPNQRSDLKPVLSTKPSETRAFSEVLRPLVDDPAQEQRNRPQSGHGTATERELRWELVGERRAIVVE